MGFKNTVEIITKDIEELEKIVRNFQNYSRIPRIELDLALGKMQNIYELILMIRESEDQMTDLSESVKSPEHESLVRKTEPQKSNLPSKQEEENMHQDSIEFLDEDDTATEEKKEEKPSNEVVSKDDSVKSEKPSNEEVPKKESKEKILAERLKKQGEFINEKIGSGNKGRDLSSRIQSTPIKSISGSMGLNDKFYFIRELFNGNAEYFRQAMNVLDQAENFNEAYNYILNTFEWDMDSDTVQQLLNLIRRKFISPGNE